MKDTTQLLLEKAERAIRAAEVLRDADEAEFAAGRVYYAMRHVAEALLYERGMVFRQHTAVRAAFAKEFAKTGLLNPKFHRWLLTASDLRLRGDYQPGDFGPRPGPSTALGTTRRGVRESRRPSASQSS